MSQAEFLKQLESEGLDVDEAAGNLEVRPLPIVPR
jgi:hypothetical protein